MTAYNRHVLENLAAAIGCLAWSPPSYMFLERKPSQWIPEAERANGLQLAKLDPTTSFETYESGSLFCAEYELRWVKVDGAFHVVYVGPEVELFGFKVEEMLNLKDTVACDREYFLWGTPLQPDQFETAGASPGADSLPFLEFRIPRILYYPVSDKAQRAKLHVVEYIDPAQRIAVFYRLQGVKEEF